MRLIGTKVLNEQKYIKSNIKDSWNRIISHVFEDNKYKTKLEFDMCATNSQGMKYDQATIRNEYW